MRSSASGSIAIRAMIRASMHGITNESKESKNKKPHFLAMNGALDAL